MCEDVIVNREQEFLGNQSSVLFHAISDSTLTTNACAGRLPLRRENRQEEVKP